MALVEELEARYNTPMYDHNAAVVHAFQGQHRFLSNFWHSPFDYEGFRYATVEHAYQAAKSADPMARMAFMVGGRHETPGQAKRAGRLLSLRRDWDKVKQPTMLRLERCKFRWGESDDLAPMLVRTWPYELVEGNTWGDRYWGRCADIGQNYLGRLLMLVRYELREEAAGRVMLDLLSQASSD